MSATRPPRLVDEAGVVVDSVLPERDAVREILVIHVTRIGDTLLSTPTLRAIAAYFPNARLTVLGHAKRVDILRHLPFIDQVGGISKKTAAFKGWLPGKRYDLAFVFGHDLPLIRYAQRVARRVVGQPQENPAWERGLFHVAARLPFQSRHAVRLQYGLIEGLGIPLGDCRLAYRVTPEESAWAAAELLRRGVKGRFPLLGLQIASFPTKGYRDWPMENFAELAERVAAAYPDAHFLIFGGDLERPRTEALAARLGTRATHLAGSLSLRETAAMMQQLDYYVGVDTGPTHIMGALQKPMLAFYHPSSPSPNLAPLDHPALTVIDHPLAGQVGPEAPMSGISVDSVWARLAPELAKLQAV